MSAASILLGFLNVCLYCAVIILVAFVIWWVITSVMGLSLDGNVYKWGKIVVVLLCLIVIVSFLLGLLPGVSTQPHFLR